MGEKRILVVDDEKECCELLKDYFVRHNYTVDIVSEGKKAEVLLEANTYQYIIFDYYMPGFSVADFANTIKEKNPQAKKILISGYDFVDDEIVKGMKVDAFLQKPFVLDDLRAILKEK